MEMYDKMIRREAMDAKMGNLRSVKKEKLKQRNDTNHHESSWWFQPIWKILVKMGIFPR